MMTQAEHNIAYRKIEAAERELNEAKNALGAYNGGTRVNSVLRHANRASIWAGRVVAYVAEKS